MAFTIDPKPKSIFDGLYQREDVLRVTYTDPRYIFDDLGSNRMKLACGCGPKCEIRWHPNADPLSRVGYLTHTDGKHYSRTAVSHEVIKHAYTGIAEVLMEQLVRQCQNDHVTWKRRPRPEQVWGEDER